MGDGLSGLREIAIIRGSSGGGSTTAADGRGAAMDSALAVELLANGTVLLGGSAAVVNCTDGVEWIWRVFGECVDDSVSTSAFVLGLMSMVLWLVPLAPQLWTNYKRSDAEGLSVYFLIFWILGDLFNLLGALLTRQLPVQIYIGGYYIFADLCLLSQFVYYGYFYKSSEVQHVPLLDEEPDDDDDEHNADGRSGTGAAVLQCVLLGCVGLSGITGSGPSSTVVRGHRISKRSVVVGRRGLMIKPWFSDIFLYDSGYGLGIASAIMYFCGRVPQLAKNHRRRSTEGLSMSMFVIIVFANLTYGLSVILAGDTAALLLAHAPWLAGSLGCCALDACVIAQSCAYNADVAPLRRAVRYGPSLLDAADSDDDGDSLLQQHDGDP